MRRASALVPLLASVGCVTFLSDAEIRGLTTCHETDWPVITKSLVRSGYVIERRDDTELVTELNGTIRLIVRRLDADSFSFEVQDGGEPYPYWEQGRATAAQLQRDVCG